MNETALSHKEARRLTTAATQRMNRINSIHCAADFRKVLLNFHFRKDAFYMVIRQLPVKDFESFKQNLEKNVRRDPLDTAYPCDIRVNDSVYRLRLYIGQKQKLYAPQAVRLSKDPSNCELITAPLTLSALTELIYTQYRAKG